MLFLGLLCALPKANGADGLHAGLLFDEFDLTLTPGHRTEALGPLFYQQEKESEHIWAVPPLLSSTRDPSVGLYEFDSLYPILTYDRYGDQYRWQLIQLLSFSGGPTQTEPSKNRFTLFPLYFQQRSSDPSQNYTALFPIYGHLKRHMFRDDIFFVLFPGYSETRKRDIVTRNYLYPLFHLREGDGLRGWQFWPLAAHEHKDVTARTNGFNDVTTIPGHDKVFVLWPLFFEERRGMGTENPEWEQTSFPAYSLLRSPGRDSTTVIWPLFSYVDDRDRKYREWDVPWPLIVFARGEGKNTSRVWPFYSRARSPTLQSDFYLWPIYKYNAAHLDPLDRKHTRILFFLYSDRVDKNTDTGLVRRRTDAWPLFTRRKDFNGSSRLQVLAVLEPFLAGSHKIDRDYSPLWSLWRQENNAKTGAASQSLLWNLYRHQTTPTSSTTSFLFGLFQSQSGPEGNRLRLLYIPLGKTKPRPQ